MTVGLNELLCATETTRGKDMRYKIVNGSNSGHCCFEATVMDMTKPEIIGGKHYAGSDGQLHYETVCECFNLKDAKLICDALNAAEARKRRRPK